MRPDHHYYRARQERHRRSFRRQLRTGEDARRKGKNDLLKIVRQISDMIFVAYVRQKEALGLGHAVLTARELIGNEPFATLLADDVIDARVPVLKQLMNVF